MAEHLPEQLKELKRQGMPALDAYMDQVQKDYGRTITEYVNHWDKTHQHLKQPGNWDPWFKGLKMAEHRGRGDRHQERDRSPLTHIDRGLLDPDLQATGSSLERARANVRAIEVLRDLDDSGREPTEDDIRALAAYAGWGGAQKAFEEGASRSGRGVEINDASARTAHRRRIRGRAQQHAHRLLHAAAGRWTRCGRRSARPVSAGIRSIPDMVLEPGCGTGNFIRSTPAGLILRVHRHRSRPDRAPASHVTCARTTTSSTTGWNGPACPTDAFDLAIGNVPYSDAISDRRHRHPRLVHPAQSRHGPPRRPRRRAHQPVHARQEHVEHAPRTRPQSRTRSRMPPAQGDVRQTGRHRSGLRHPRSCANATSRWPTRPPHGRTPPNSGTASPPTGCSSTIPNSSPEP